MTYDEIIKQAETLYNAHEYQQAVACATQAIEMDKNRLEGYYWRGLSYRRTHEKEKEILDAESLLACKPETALHFVYRGWACCVKGDCQQAVKECTEALGKDDSVKEAYNYRGWAYADLKESDRAIENFDKAIGLDPKYAVAFNYRGNAYSDKGDHDRAIADYSDAIRLDPKDVAAYNNRGVAYSDKGDYDLAIADYSDAIVLDPKNAVAFNNRGFAYSDKGDYDRAIADYSDAIRLDPKDAAAFCSRGSAYHAKGAYDFAIEDYSKAIELAPTFINAYRNRGKTYNEQGDYGCAAVDFGRCVELDPADTVTLKAFLDDVEEYGWNMEESAWKQLRESGNHWVSLVGDILSSVVDYKKYIKLIKVVFEVQTKEEFPETGAGEKEKYFYQYFGYDILADIQKSKALWLRPSYDMNDDTEGRIIFKYLKARLAATSERLPVLMEALDQSTKEWVKASREGNAKGTVTFIRSFSAYEDELPIWGRYAQDGKGVALGIHGSKLNQANNKSAINRKKKDSLVSGTLSGLKSPCVSAGVLLDKIYFSRVLYLYHPTDADGDRRNSDRILEACKDDIACFEKVVEAVQAFDDDFLARHEEEVKTFFARIFIPISHLVKNVNYRDEGEWRLLYLTSVEDGTEAGVVKKAPVLHIETAPVLFKDKKMKEELWLGPKSGLKQSDVEDGFKAAGLDGTVDIKPSKLHYS